MEKKKLDYNALAVFLTVVEAESFSGAARRLGMPVSTVSRKVSELEEKWRVRLLERSTRSLRLTEVGVRIYDQARLGFDALENVTQILSDRQTTLRGVIRLSAPPSLSETVLAPVLVEFQRRHSEVRVSCMVTERRTDFIADGLDVALRIDPSDRRRTVETHLLTYRHLLVASPDYVAGCEGGPRHPKDLADHRTIGFAGWPDDNTWRATNGQQQRLVQLRPILVLNDYAGVAAAARAGHGIAELPPFCCLEDLERGSLVEVMTPWRLVPVTMSAVQLRRPYPSRIVKAFLQVLTESLPRMFPDLPA